MSERDLKRPRGSKKRKIIVGRGPGGKRSLRAGTGNKGQNSRSGGGVRPGFEGGQMPLYRRVPRKGFSNSRFKDVYEVVNVGDLGAKYQDGETVDVSSLRAKRLVNASRKPVKLLGTGTIEVELTVRVDAASKSAREKVERAGGTVELGTSAKSSEKAAGKESAEAVTAAEEEKVQADGE